jgi:hypothetical protein
VSYGGASLRHLDENGLGLYYWDEATGSWVALQGVVDAAAKTITAQTASLGQFDLEAPLICPADSHEPDDRYYLAQAIVADGAATADSFDIADDEDWFSFDAEAGKSYVIETGTLAAGVDTVLELYDLGGVTLLASDDNSGGGKASRLTWQAPLSGTYFVRVRPVAGSASGCSASYSLSVRSAQGSNNYSVYLPVVPRNH